MTAKPVLAAVEPQLFVSDINAACDFYADKLGFQTVFLYGGPPFYAQVQRDTVRLNLRHTDSPAFDDRFRQSQPDALSATVTLEDAAPLFEEFQASGATFHQLLRQEPWGAKTFIVRDPDGNLLAFAS
ncbi:VOC family protein [Pararhizobium sp. BT-229]|uniref:VOC family protein n=1 Tax=Pararhizobium sp. BT-229 TaxID=2986923 RepID=UPI0021F7F24C|nr:VOC family protein [Pararhizobium sp. BT-229]MCV9966476.1 VOC family protein [Pararhizobium sp. BT-229]